MVNKVLNYKFKSSYICKISWNIWTNAFFNWNLIEINFLQKAKNHNYDNLAIEALVYMKNVRHITYCRNPIIASLLLWYADSRISALGTCWAPISVSVTRGFFSDDWDTAEDRSDTHRFKSCRADIRCEECGSSQHPTALHPPETQIQNGGEGENILTKCTAVCGAQFTGRSCAKAVLVDVYPKETPSQRLCIYALIDDQSNSTLARSIHWVPFLAITFEQLIYVAFIFNSLQYWLPYGIDPGVLYYD